MNNLCTPFFVDGAGQGVNWHLKKKMWLYMWVFEMTAVLWLRLVDKTVNRMSWLALCEWFIFSCVCVWQAIQTASSQPSEDRLRSQYLQQETTRFRLESDLDNVRRRLDQSEGSKAALQNQVYPNSFVLNRFYFIKDSSITPRSQSMAALVAGQ